MPEDAPISLPEAQRRVLARVARLPAEQVSLADAAGRTLADDLRASSPLPPFAHSAMDGYAVQAADTVNASPDAPTRLRVVGTVTAGDGATYPMQTGDTFRIMTGAPVPFGADTVVPVEQTDDGGGATVTFFRPARIGAHIRQVGEELATGGIALHAGTVINPAAVALLAALGVARMAVVRRPQVVVISTGNELVSPGGGLGAGEIADANGPLLAALVAQWGGAVQMPLSIVRDEPAAVQSAIAAARGADFVITSGGASRGLFDVVRPLLEDAGAADFTRVWMKPGQPCAFGMVEGMPMLALPGNPGAAFVTFHLLARPAFARMLGQSPELLSTLPARLRTSFAYRGERPTFLRARLIATATGWEAETALRQGAGNISGLVAANALVALPEGERQYAAGEIVQAHLLGT